MKKILAFLLASSLATPALAECGMKKVDISYYADVAKKKFLRTQSAHALSDGAALFRSRLHINFDGSRKAYHKDNLAGGAILNLCNAASVYLPDGSHYAGSESDKTCTGKFLRDYKRIADSGWHDPKVGLINWYGVLGKDAVKIRGKTITSVQPIEQSDGSGFFLSPTSLGDGDIPDTTNAERYIDPTTIAGAVVRNPKLVSQLPIEAGSFGVAYDPNTKTAVPFIVGDYGPRVGEGTPYLARRLGGVSDSVPYDRKHRAEGGVDPERIIWIFFRKEKLTAGLKSAAISQKAAAAYEQWGGKAKLEECVKTSVGKP